MQVFNVKCILTIVCQCLAHFVIVTTPNFTQSSMEKSHDPKFHIGLIKRGCLTYVIVNKSSDLNMEIRVDLELKGYIVC